MNTLTTFVYEGHPMFEMLVGSCSNYTADNDIREFDIGLCCDRFLITARRIYVDLEKTSLIGYEILRTDVRAL